MTNNKHNKNAEKCSPLSVRVTPEERRALLDAAGDLRLSDFVRGRLFGSIEHDGLTENYSHSLRLSPLERQRLLAQILAKLGETSALQSLQDLAEAAQLGLLPLSPDVLDQVDSACSEISSMRLSLMKALGLRPSSNKEGKGT
uniref:hypothetical protein n=1 Tax=Pararhizobium sp. IMCC3301 TaxID=3067904 RepID=UPI002741A230|nr:hypothetical protein [Pararhizobium sp. IMCC3301]